MQRRSRLAAGILALAALGFSVPASAFCRTTTCGPNTCQADPSCQFCLNGGKPLFWRNACVSFSTQQSGSPQRGLDVHTSRNVIAGGLSKWMSVDCGGAPPGIQVFDFGAVECAKQEYNQDAPNANIWMYRDGFWPYSASSHTLALTTITFNVESGEIFDADVEINSADNPLTLGDDNVQADLDSIVTHEAGHFLGLAHSCSSDATMFPSYKFGEVKLRSLDADDAAGICDIYPPSSRTQNCDATPRHGFSTKCRTEEDKGCCTTAPGTPSSSGPPAIAALLLLAVAGGARRRRRRA